MWEHDEISLEVLSVTRKSFYIAFRVRRFESVNKKTNSAQIIHSISLFDLPWLQRLRI